MNTIYQKSYLLKILTPLMLILLAISTHAANPPVDWKIDHTTVVLSPQDRSRIKVGVGEKVDLKAPCPADWTIQGGGTLSATTGTTTQFTAPETAAQVTITAKLHVDNSTKSVTFDVIEPNAIKMEKLNDVLTTPTPYLQLSFTAAIYILPADVNFEAISVGENDVLSVSTGYYKLLFPNEINHKKNGPDGMDPHVNNKGTPKIGFDYVDSGRNAPQYSAGSFHWAIPWRYELGATNKVFTTVDHKQEITIDATIGKATQILTKQSITRQVTEP